MHAHRAASSQGFSLIELISVLSIVAILATLTATTGVRRLRVAEQEADARTVASIAQAFDQVVLDRKVLPGTNDWVQFLTPELDRPAADIAATRSGCARVLLYHPSSALHPGASARFQTASGFANASNGVDRVLVLSTLQAGFPTNVNPSSVAAFNALWNTRPGERPAGWAPEALPDPADLNIAKIDLARLIHRVTLNNLTASNTPVRVSLADNATVLTIPKSQPNLSWHSHFIHGTSLNLHDSDSLLVRQELITEDRTLYFVDGTWGPGNVSGGLDLSALLVGFLEASFPNAINQQRPRAAVDELYRALWSYIDWAEEGFPEAGNNKKQGPEAYVIRSAIARLNQGTLNLIGSGGGQGGGQGGGKK